MVDSRHRQQHLRSRFRDLFGVSIEPGLAVAPGRVNLIGEHTDYNDGWVLPMAIDRHVWIAFAPRPDPVIRAYSVDFEETLQIALEDLESLRGTEWISYIAGVAWAMQQAGLELAGIDLAVDGDIPLGSGLSSSAALEMATARALCEVSGIPWQPQEMARLSQKAENEFVGVSCGLMDQLVSAAAEPGCALLLDCRTLDTEVVPVPDDAKIVVMDTGTPRSLAGSAYNDRRSTCIDAVGVLQGIEPSVRALRDVDRELLSRARSQMGTVTFRRASHVVDEIHRPRAMAEALLAGSLELAGQIMNESHSSLRDLYEVSSPELDLITDLARRHPSCFGARLTGAGFGGCAVALVSAQGTDSFVEAVHSAYTSQTDLPGELFACTPVGGAHLLEPAQTPNNQPSVVLEE